MVFEQRDRKLHEIALVSELELCYQETYQNTVPRASTGLVACIIMRTQLKTLVVPRKDHPAGDKEVGRAF